MPWNVLGFMQLNSSCIASRGSLISFLSRDLKTKDSPWSSLNPTLPGSSVFLFFFWDAMKIHFGWLQRPLLVYISNCTIQSCSLLYGVQGSREGKKNCIKNWWIQGWRENNSPSSYMSYFTSNHLTPSLPCKGFLVVFWLRYVKMASSWAGR